MVSSDVVAYRRKREKEGWSVDTLTHKMGTYTQILQIQGVFSKLLCLNMASATSCHVSCFNIY